MEQISSLKIKEFLSHVPLEDGKVTLFVRKIERYTVMITGKGGEVLTSFTEDDFREKSFSELLGPIIFEYRRRYGRFRSEIHQRIERKQGAEIQPRESAEWN